MKISADTKIASLLKAHPDTLEAIVSLSPDFKKLRNPVLRKLMAGRTSIAMAAKIGGCTPEDFFKKLKPLGFEIAENGQQNQTEEKEGSDSREQLPEALKNLPSAKIISLDVRPVLADGNDPLKLIQQKIKELRPDEVLLIINTFEPTPLIKLLAKQGFQSYVAKVSGGQIETWFYKTKEVSGYKPDEGKAHSADWERIYSKYQDSLLKMDVRHLEMPQPMMRILEALESMPKEKALYVHHKRIPVFLLTELKDQGFDFRIKETAEGEVYLLIFK